mmetsp:Transcript_22323/g.44563  ORF Transcript_22323/g.44563 Transcript_22323/m.44563 type:complete len:213 (-) Transcript_22323:328-966(-)
MPLARLMGKSRRGELMAATAASDALDLPAPVPTPMRAVPALPMMVLTSAKSTLIRPGFMMISLMPTTPWRRMSSATKKASVTGVFSGTICRSLSLETTMRVSTAACNSSMALFACCMRFLPSKPKGLVTTPTVRQPQSLAISATMGAAPEPVPPPMPAVTNTRSAPVHTASISALDSCAAPFPTAGLPPAPRPRVTFLPMLSVLRAMDFVSA